MDEFKKKIYNCTTKLSHGTAKQPVLKSEITLPAIHLQVSMYHMIMKQLYIHEVKPLYMYMYHS